MALEIERKFLVDKTRWQEFKKKHTLEKIRIRQGYFPTEKAAFITRISQRNEKAYLTLKSWTQNITRSEYEYEIPFDDASALLLSCQQPIIEKTRYFVKTENYVWEVDEFFGDNEGLLIAEIELSNEHENFPKPEPNFLSREVSNEPRFYNANLIHYPFSKWTADEKK